MAVGESTVAAIGYGTTLGFNATAGATSGFTLIAELTDIKLPTFTATPIEVQRYDSPTKFGELITGWAKAGSVGCELVYAKTQAAALYALFNTVATYQVTKTDSSTWTYTAIMTEFADAVPLKDKMTNAFKFDISGAPTPSPASA